MEQIDWYEELQDFLLSYFNQDMGNIKEALDTFVENNDISYKNIVLNSLEAFKVADWTSEQKEQFILNNVFINFPAIKLSPLEWIEKIYILLKKDLNSQEVEVNIELFKKAIGVAENLIDQDHVIKYGAVFAINEAVEVLKSISKFSKVDYIKVQERMLDYYNSSSTSSNIIVKNKDSEPTPWYTSEYSNITWRFWNRYRKYLLETKEWDSRTVDGLDISTEGILRRFEYPKFKDEFDIRGLVVGEVQSGKTSNYTGLICKSLDLGYNLVIVLTGIHDDLRSQTQIRLDEEVIGRKSGEQSKGLIGVGLIEELQIQCLTSRYEGGDVNSNLLSRVGVYPTEGNPLILVVKKNKYILEAIRDYFKNKTHGISMLMIDDEADQASIDTNNPESIENEEYNPTTINALIREILLQFKQRVYTGYTATPFANVLIDHQLTHDKYGPDLFPKDFIVSLITPPNYVGPNTIFGTEGHPILRTTKDEIQFNMNEEGLPTSLPNSLRQAFKSFILSTAIRVLRGQTYKHNSMLVHINRSVNFQKVLTRLVHEELEQIKIYFKYDDNKEQKDKIIDELKGLWEDDFIKTTATICGPNNENSWDEITQILHEVIQKITVQMINGQSTDSLNYKENVENGLYVIAIGGDKLSRGLTLEGLTTSYYLRSSNMYDTLMQMGRWFGYRDGYVDLCRIYTSPILIENYRYITKASNELRENLKLMEVWGKSPTSFGLKILSNPDLQVTSQLKMKDAFEVTESLSFSGSTSQTVVFEEKKDIVEGNYYATLSFINDLGKPQDQKNGNYLWHIKPETILEYLNDFSTPENALTVKTNLWSDYIKEQLQQNELINWTVALMSNQHENEHSFKVTSDIICNPASRQYLNRMDGIISIGTLLSQGDEFLDIDVQQEASKKIKTLRALRPVTNGLLLVYPLIITDKFAVDGKKPSIKSLDQRIIGLAACFPYSETAQTINYVANTVYIRNNE
ncbi:contact-dependent growth inhibition system immunity protein [Paenibacillus sp. MDMC362]|uniref:contact-dependent growth inhibition system immunity protein n=1 Tax=Paenibacillus sp. MDMC362 TaxID=2977365 RepID=UPI000DC5CD2E|nr:contact-dependent growth inhibition system immunity protein [Paenibacillus sp. MDMC362]RAR42739.1 hypothetical protein DP091_16965 [Paenibacillus sp. MDMC362]